MNVINYGSDYTVRLRDDAGEYWDVDVSDTGPCRGLALGIAIAMSNADCQKAEITFRKQSPFEGRSGTRDALQLIVDSRTPREEQWLETRDGKIVAAHPIEGSRVQCQFCWGNQPEHAPGCPYAAAIAALALAKAPVGPGGTLSPKGETP